MSIIQALFGYSSVFKTINSDLASTITGVTSLSNQAGILGTSFRDLIDAYKTLGAKGLKNAVSNKITNIDIECLREYNELIGLNVGKEKALEKSMQGASKAARQMAIDANGGQVSLKGLTASANTSKLAIIGLKVATVAANIALSMGLSWAIQSVVTLFDNMAHAAERASESADEAFSKAKESADKEAEETKTLDELIEKYKELKSKGNSVDD